MACIKARHGGALALALALAHPRLPPCVWILHLCLLAVFALDL